MIQTGKKEREAFWGGGNTVIQNKRQLKYKYILEQ